MMMADPYNYVIKDYKAQISAPKTIKAGDTFNITFTHSNISVENKIKVDFLKNSTYNKGDITFAFLSLYY